MQRRKIAIALAFAGCLPTPLPLSWLHKFYLGQYLWGVAYLVLVPTGIPAVACCIEGIWYLSQSDQSFEARFPASDEVLLPSDSSSQTKEGKTTAGNIKDGRAKDNRTKDDKVKFNVQNAQQVAAAIRDLDQLRQDGLITEYEFEQKRRRLLEEIA